MGGSASRAEIERLKKSLNDMQVKLLQSQSTSTNAEPDVAIRLADKLVLSDLKLGDVIGQASMKKEIRVLDCDSFLGAYFLFGPSGCGKTYCSLAMSSALNAKLLSLNSPDLVGKGILQSVQILTDVFALAKAEQPCVLFFDEFDFFFTGEPDRVAQLDSLFRKLIDDLKKNGKGVLLWAATNIPDNVPTPVRSRFTSWLYFALPIEKERYEYLQSKFLTMFQYYTVKEDDFLALAKKTEGFSFRDLETLLTHKIPLAQNLKKQESEYFKKELVRDEKSKTDEPKYVPCEKSDARGIKAENVEEKEIVIVITPKLVEFAMTQVIPQTSRLEMDKFEAWAKEFGAKKKDVDF